MIKWWRRRRSPSLRWIRAFEKADISGAMQQGIREGLQNRRRCECGTILPPPLYTYVVCVCGKKWKRKEVMLSGEFLRRDGKVTQTAKFHEWIEEA